MKSYQNNNDEESDLVFDAEAISQGNTHDMTINTRGGSRILLSVSALAGCAVYALSSLHATHSIFREEDAATASSRVPLLGKAKKYEGHYSDVAVLVYAEFGFVESEGMVILIYDFTIAIAPTD